MKLIKYILMFFSTLVLSQNTKVKTQLDTTQAKIGEEIKITFQTTVDTLSKVVFPEGKFFGSLEILESYPTDTVLVDFKYQLIKKYGLTQFDSGYYQIPSLQVLINEKPYFSDSLKVYFQDIAVDTLTQGMYDIRPIIVSSDIETPWWQYLIVLFVLILLGFGIYFGFKTYQIKKNTVAEIVYASPIEKATAQLKALETKDLLSKGDVKAYYSELTDIARTYIEETIDVPAMESTTSELIQSLKIAIFRRKLTVNQDTLEEFEAVLKQADLVKFAKSKPLDFEIIEDQKRIQKTIVNIHKSIPIETVDVDLMDAAQKAGVLQKQKSKRTLHRALIAAGMLVLTFFALVIAIGYDEVKDYLVGNPTKELLEGNWIRSEYGNPSIKLETPEVLQRIINENQPSELLSPLQEQSLFAYGSIADDLEILLYTASFKEELTEVLDVLLEEELVRLEKQGAQNLIVKTENYPLAQGIEGKKAFGTFTHVNLSTNKTEKRSYQILLFVQKNSIQKVTITYKGEDTFAIEIGERILDSVELGSTQ
jgi:hypothetical protein